MNWSRLFSALLLTCSVTLISISLPLCNFPSVLFGFQISLSSEHLLVLVKSTVRNRGAGLAWHHYVPLVLPEIYTVSYGLYSLVARTACAGTVPLKFWKVRRHSYKVDVSKKITLLPAAAFPFPLLTTTFVVYRCSCVWLILTDRCLMFVLCTAEVSKNNYTQSPTLWDGNTFTWK